MNSRESSSKALTIADTLKGLNGEYQAPKWLYAFLVILYVVASFLVARAAAMQGTFPLFGREVPYTAFTGVFSSLANLCLIFLVLCYRKWGFILSVLILFIYQFPVLTIQFFFRGNMTGIAGLFNNLFTLATLIIIFLMNRKDAKYKKRIHYQAVTDRLTLLPNRFAGRELANKLINDKERFVTVSVDINNFKSINDTMGHEFGDKVLIEIANRWKNLADSGQTGTNDFITRLGGDEFLIIIRDYDSEEQFMHTIDEYKEDLERKLTIDNCDYFLTANYGIAEFPTDALDSDALLSGANAAMHEASRHQHTSVLRFDTSMIKSGRSLEIERIIRNALENDGITCFLQPQYDLSHKLCGFEALARMKDEDGNFVSPAEFIPVAESRGLVDQIDVRVFSKAAEFLNDVIEKTESKITISTNVSVKHLMKNDFLQETQSILNLYSIPADRVEIEITESIMIDSTEKALKCINELKKMGFKIAIDDFGTGYSSLSYLNNLPSDYLKIDKSFIDVMNDNESTKQYVATIISIGHILHLGVISEGVESDDQIDTLRSVGCDYIQGFVWGRPMPVDEAFELVKTSA